mmetsp:Transcript_98387/g.175184  ORF Transcript_98387/g.175184 Transcript_98387/m.175184 type:complete len:366 (-) Transcript_98387:139-1236(-)
MGKEAMLVKRLRAEAAMPVRGTEHAAGFDLAAAEETVVPAGGKAIVKTGLSIAIPEGTYARIAPRSGLAAKKMINTGAGVVDYDYRGEVGVVLFNHGAEDFSVAAGDRIAQLILEKVCMVPCVEVSTLDETARGSGGFGSTGVAEATTGYAKTQTKQEAMQVEVMQVRRLNPSATLPVRGSEYAAGFDLSAVEELIVPAGGKAIAKTGLAIAIPANTYARIAPRSGLAAKKMIHVGAGVVDYDYRGEVGVVLFNHGMEDFQVQPGDRVAQLILEDISMASCLEVQSLDETQRGAGGLGSTGVEEALTPAAKKQFQEVGTPEKTSARAPDELQELRDRVASLEAQLAKVMATVSAPENTKKVVTEA